MSKDDCNCGDEEWRVLVDTKYINGLNEDAITELLLKLGNVMKLNTELNDSQIHAIISGLTYTMTSQHMIYIGKRDDATQLMKSITGLNIPCNVSSTKLLK
jgi:hypothetical protein